MPDLDLRLLRYFVAIAECGSFTDAAVALGVTQPALSQGLRRLEDVMGLPLLKRGPRGSARALTLTSAGASCLDDARGLLMEANRLLQRTRQNADRVRLRIGFGTSTPRNLTRAILQGAEGFGHIELLLVFVPWGDEVASLERGDVDAVFFQAWGDFSDPRIEGIALRTVRRLAVFHIGHPLAGRGALVMRELDDEPIMDAASDRDYWIVNPRPSGRMPVTVGPPARTVDEMLAFVSAGRGMAITSASVADKNSSADLSFVPIDDLDPATVFLVRHRSDRRPHMRALFQNVALAASNAPGIDKI